MTFIFSMFIDDQNDGDRRHSVHGLLVAVQYPFGECILNIISLIILYVITFDLCLKLHISSKTRLRNSIRWATCQSIKITSDVLFYWNNDNIIIIMKSIFLFLTNFSKYTSEFFWSKFNKIVLTKTAKKITFLKILTNFR